MIGDPLCVCCSGANLLASRKMFAVEYAVDYLEPLIPLLGYKCEHYFCFSFPMIVISGRWSGFYPAVDPRAKVKDVHKKFGRPTFSTCRTFVFSQFSSSLGKQNC